MQTILVSIIVTACLGYAVWTLMPSIARNWIRRVVLHLPMKAAEGCGDCSDCAGSPSPANPATREHVVRVVRR